MDEFFVGLEWCGEVGIGMGMGMGRCRFLCGECLERI